MFCGRTLLIVTKHKKELIIAPILEKELGVKCIVTNDFDTDKLGTFSGEIERTGTPIETAKNKCILASKNTGYDLVLASEGSFGPHPFLYFVPSDEEILILIDKTNNLEFQVKELSTDTNFNGKEITNEQELIEFANICKFPSHGLIIKSSKGEYNNFIKGIQDWDQLINYFNKNIKDGSSVYVETDMRAFCNPTRMKIIENATIKLVEKIKSVCPNCQTPGFGITDIRDGLPCSLCGRKTRSILSYIRTCQKCAYTQEEMFPKGKKEEDPLYCDFCNP